MSVAIKICGIRDTETALHAAHCGADYIGLNFVPASPRFIERDIATDVAAELHQQAEACRVVGLFVDVPNAEVLETAQSVGLDVVQLHGRETAKAIADLRQTLPNATRLWKAIPFETEQIDAWRDVADIDALLIDAPHVAGELTGGTGRTLDWDALRSLDRTGLPPIMLAGGLTPNNVAEAIRVADPWGVDVSSGVESARGVKDLQKIKAFCDAARDA